MALVFGCYGAVFGWMIGLTIGFNCSETREASWAIKVGVVFAIIGAAVGIWIT
jgi:hypothetical protein